MRKRVITLVLTLIGIIILSVIFIYFSDDRRSAIKTIYVSDTTLLDHRIIWDKNGKLVNPEALDEILGKDSIREVESGKDLTYRKK